MAGNWADYQSAIQLMAAVNLGLFGLPELRQPEYQAELRRQSKLVEMATLLGQQRLGETSEQEFRAQWQGLATRLDQARIACVMAAIFCTAVLLCLSGPRAGQPAKAGGLLAWATIAIGLLPGLWFLVLNLLIRRKVPMAAERRRALERQILAGAAAAGADITPGEAGQPRPAGDPPQPEPPGRQTGKGTGS